MRGNWLLTAVLWLALVHLSLSLWDRWLLDPLPLVVVVGLAAAVGVVYLGLTGAWWLRRRVRGRTPRR